MNTYKIESMKLSNGKTRYIVINQVTGQAHSLWNDFTAAHTVVRDLNRIAFKRKVA